MKSNTQLLTKPFDIYVPASENREARKVATIEVQVRIDEDGDEVLTQESLDLIDKTQARYMGLLMGEDIRALRERLNLSQDELSDMLGCGKKSLSRWENGHGYPSQLVNTLLRLLDEGLLTPAKLRELQQPRPDWTCMIFESEPISHCFQFSRSTAPVWDDCPAAKRGQLNLSALFG
jgi:putative zinc finger/helix-turn-helix YgiT family protein